MILSKVILDKDIYIVDEKTKNLLKRIKANQIAIINHSDIDEIAANGLIAKKIKAVINFSESITGKYPTIGLKKLLKAKIPVYDVTNFYNVFYELKDNEEIIIDEVNKIIILSNTLTLPIYKWDLKRWEEKYNEANKNLEFELGKFIDNTLEYAVKEKEFVLKPLNRKEIKTKIKGRHVVVVVRGNNYCEDLLAIKSYIKDYNPVLIGVDGGADALLEHGFNPDIIIGDMDSVTDKALLSNTEVIVHGYTNGYAPGLERVLNIGVKPNIISSIGTSEDIAMLLAYEEGAKIIVALGAHNNMIDFLEKGRKGMASTLLVRMKIGTKLIDAKGVNMLYNPRVEFKSLSLIAIAATTPVIAISVINNNMVRLLEMVWINLKLFFT